MATQEIIIKYKADVGNLETELNQVIKAQDELIDATKANTKEQQKAITSQEFAAKKRADLLKNEQKQLELLRQKLKLAFDPKEIEQFNRQIQQSQQRIALLRGEASGVQKALSGFGSNLINQFKGVGVAVAAAFSVQAIIEFSKASIDAFIEAEKVAERLRFAIVTIGGESEVAFQRLEAQAGRVQRTSIFGDEQIKEAQAALATFGLTSNQIEELIPGLADLATVLGTDIVGAAQKVGAGLQGAGREFKKLNIDVSATNTPLQNYQSILQGVAQFTGAAEDATKTLSGQIAQNNERLGDLQEFVGAKLAESFTKFKLAVFEATAALLGFNNETERIKRGAENFDRFSQQYGKAAERIKSEGGDVIQTFTTAQEVAVKRVEELQAIVDKDKGFENLNVSGDAYLRKQQEIYIQNKLLLEQEQQRLNVIDKILQSEIEASRVVTAESLKVKDLQQLNALYEENKNAADAIGESNLKLIQAEIDLRKKAAEEAEKAEKARLDALAKVRDELAKLQQQQQQQQIELIDPRSFNEAIDKYNQLADIQKKGVDAEIDNLIAAAKANGTYTKELEAEFNKIRKFRKDAIDFQKLNQITIFDEAQQEQIKASLKAIEDLKFQDSLQLKADEIETNNQRVADSFEALKNSLSKGDFAISEQQLRENTQRLNQSIQEEADIRKNKIRDQATLDAAALGQDEVSQAKRTELFATADAKIREINKETKEKIEQNNKASNDATEQGAKELTEKIAQNYIAVAQQIGQVFNEIAALSSVFTEKRIDDINKELEAQLSAIEQEKEANQEAFDLRRISEEEFNEKNKELLAQQVKAEQETQKKIREEKRKQAILDKAAALFQIGLNTAIALSNPSNLASFGALSPFIAALGALQAAAVLAQPIPYKKGSKNTGRKDHLAKVGEEGEELVWMPANSKVLPHRQTKRYSDVIDAMYDNRLDDYIYKNYVTPALMQQKEKKQAAEQRSFAENITKSLTYNNVGLSASDLEAQRKRGQYIRNVDEIAEAIASKLPVRDIYR